MSFESFLAEDKGGKNLHLEHLEDEILNYGVDGGRAALDFLRSLRDMLAGSARSSVSITQNGTAHLQSLLVLNQRQVTFL